MSYNFLRNARTILNSLQCRYDTLDGYSTDLSINGDFDGWDVYSDVYMYGSWNGVLFGSSYERECYISRTNVFNYVSAEYYYTIKVMMKVTNNNSDKVVGSMTTGRIQWVTLNDSIWDSNKQTDFDLIVDNKWHLYQINMGPEPYWQGDVNNLRIYPFIDGWPDDQFAIKYIKISSIDYWTCNNTQCSYYTNYEHNCPGAGAKASIEAGNSYSTYSTISGVNDKLIVNINGYGDEEFELGNNTNLNGIEMAKVITNKLGSLNMGCYIYAQVEYSEYDRIKITSGSTGSNSSISIPFSDAAEILGFYENDVDISTYTSGADQATGFDYASSRIFTPYEINRMMDGNSIEVAYKHDPLQFNVEGGRRDFNEIGNSKLLSDIVGSEYYDSLDNSSRTIIDISHPINNNGRIKSIYMFGKIKDDTTARIKICRPLKNGNLKVIHSLTFDNKIDNTLYTKRPLSHKIDCDILVEKGDFIGVYNADIYVGVSINRLPDASFYQYNGEVSGTFDPGRLYSFGIAGLSIYARSDRLQTNAILDIDMGNRVNIEQVDICGVEESSYFEFNLASCADITWDINLYNQSHFHSGYLSTNYDSWSHTHTNIAYGEECLDDMIITSDGGQCGDSWGYDNGLATYGTHTYFYVNGDAEWVFSGDPNEIAEYYPPYIVEKTGGFTIDPISFTLLLPNDKKCSIHKSIIYFKEEDNFRCFELSYYLGSHSALGNAYKDTTFKRISSYNSIRLDGLLYNDSNKELIEDYLFVNPTSSRPIYRGGTIQNPTTVKIANSLYWNILEHNFDDVDAGGFRIYTNYHNSTKIMEIEVYSKMVTDPDLVDNITILFSDYGTTWKSASFEEILNNKVSAFIGGSPRYFKLELESTNVFNINEISFLLNDQLKLDDCSDIVLMNNAKSNVIESATPVEISNIYDKPFDLIVNLPHEISENDGLVFWSKLNSEDDIENPDVGPACFLYKEDGYDILNDNMQCAINVPSYGLKNLIDGKLGYYSYSEGETWTSSGTLSSGISLDFSCKDAFLVKSEVTISGISSKYWQLVMGEKINLDSFRVYYEDEELDIYNLQNDYKSGSYLPFLLDDTNGNMVYPIWTEYTTSVGDNLDIVFNGLESDSFGVSTGGPYVETVVSPTLTDFTMIFDFILQRDVNNRMGGLDIYFYDSLGTQIIRFYIMDQWSSFDWATLVLYDKNVLRVNNYPLSINNDGINTNRIYLKRTGNNLVLKLDDNIKYNSTFSTESISKIRIGFKRYEGYNPPDKTAIYFGDSYCFNLDSSRSIDTIKLKYDGDLVGASIYVSSDDVSYSKWGDVNFELQNSIFYDYFAIDLENRHVLDFIRNYGNSISKLLLTGAELDYSSTDTSNIDDVVWDSDVSDARWIRFNLLSGDGVDRYLRKIGVYPDISVNACHDSGYNCEWESLGTILTDYTNSVNVAYGATVTGTNNYFGYWFPEYVVNGIHNSDDTNECWGFQKIDGIDPYLELDFGQLYNINRIRLYHGCSEHDTIYMNTDYTIGISTTVSGDFSTIVSESGNDELYIEYEFDTVSARRLRLTITDYDYESQRVIDSNGELQLFVGSFLREIEVYTSNETGYINSEDWPVVCTYLKHPFLITNHELTNINNAPDDSDWDNDEGFFRYSDDLFTDPQKISFVREGSYVPVYYSSESSGDWLGNVEYVFDREVFISKGYYRLTWEAYDVDSDDEVSIRFEGSEIIDVFAENIDSNDWVGQDDVVQINIDGFYDIKGIQHINYTDHWGVRYPLLQKSQGETTWVAVKRDTATNYSYDDDSDKYGIDYLSNIKIYGDRKYRPTEYYWWWNSTLSTLSNDIINTKVGSKSLKIDYPVSSGTDMVTIIEGDDFGQDDLWSPKDMLLFWWRIDDVSKLDDLFGSIRFGSLNINKVFYYEWYISNLNLSNGWNLVKLKFDDYDYVYPEVSSYFSNPYLDDNLDLLNNDKDLKSFYLSYRGLGSSFTMNIDDIHIERNEFEDDVKFGKGLCLTGKESLIIPVSNVTLEKGAIEFWLKTYYDSYGRDAFNNINSKTLFTMVNNNNDLISIGLKSGEWFEVLSGNLRTDLNKFETSYANLQGDNYIERNEVVHLALAWSNDSEFMDNDNTIRLFLNGILIYISNVQWSVGDTKSVSVKFGGGNTQLAYDDEGYGSGIFENVKIYNYCKTEFNPYIRGIDKDVVYTPNQFLELSPDNINFYDVDSDQLPFTFEQVPAGESRTIYLRTNKDDNFKQSKKTASLVVQWLTTV